MRVLLLDESFLAAKNVLDYRRDVLHVERLRAGDVREFELAHTAVEIGNQRIFGGEIVTENAWPACLPRFQYSMACSRQRVAAKTASDRRRTMRHADASNQHRRVREVCRAERHSKENGEPFRADRIAGTFAGRSRCGYFVRLGMSDGQVRGAVSAKAAGMRPRYAMVDRSGSPGRVSKSGGSTASTRLLRKFVLSDPQTAQASMRDHAVMQDIPFAAAKLISEGQDDLCRAILLMFEHLECALDVVDGQAMCNDGREVFGCARSISTAVSVSWLERRTL